MKIRPVEPELFLADEKTDGRTDVTKLIVAFRNFANAPKIICSLTSTVHAVQYTLGYPGEVLALLYQFKKCLEDTFTLRHNQELYTLPCLSLCKLR
jgi:hypothetical protein